VDGDILPDIIFTQADPPIGGLRTWPYTQPDTKNNHKHNLTNLHTSLRRLVKSQTYNNRKATNTIYSNILKQARDNGADHSIHAYSTSPFKARRDALEVAWGVHVHRCKRKTGPSPICSKCQSPLNNTHLLGGCSHTAKLRTKRHNSTFLLLHQLLQKSNGGRWPVIGVDLGKQPITDFRKHIPSTDDTNPSNLPPITPPEQEGLQDDKYADPETPHIIPEYILPAQFRPTHHKPDIIRAIGYTIGPDGTLKEDPTYRGRRQLQLIECKYSTDGIMVTSQTS
jgi:hypothetical protein